jgi:hypothetical protein
MKNARNSVMFAGADLATDPLHGGIDSHDACGILIGIGQRNRRWPNPIDADPNRKDCA